MEPATALTAESVFSHHCNSKLQNSKHPLSTDFEHCDNFLLGIRKICESMPLMHRVN